MWPQVLGEDGELVLMTAIGLTSRWGDSRVVLHDLESGSTTVIADRAVYGRYVESGHVLYVDDQGTLFAQRFDLDRREAAGDPFTVEERVRTPLWSGGAASYAVARNGTAVFVRGTNASNHELRWVERDGTIGEPLAAPRTSGAVRLSPDGRSVLTWLHRLENADLWIMDASSGDATQLTTDPGWDWYGVWSPDGDRIVHKGDAQTGEQVLYLRSAQPGARSAGAEPVQAGPACCQLRAVRVGPVPADRFVDG